MWIRPQRLAMARMPSLRPLPSAPPPVAPPAPPHMAPSSTAPQSTNAAAAQPQASAAQSKKSAPPPVRDDEGPLSEEQERARAGGFYESSYELRAGLDTFESDWPDDTTLPGALGER